MYIFHNIELKTKVCVAILDSKKAFDTVWRKAIMYKMCNLWVSGKLWCINNDFHSISEIAVV